MSQSKDTGNKGAREQSKVQGRSGVILSLMGMPKTPLTEMLESRVWPENVVTREKEALVSRTK